MCEITAKVEKGKENAKTNKLGPGPSETLWNKPKRLVPSDKGAMPVDEDDKRLRPKQLSSSKHSLSLSREGETRVPLNMDSSLSPLGSGRCGSATARRNAPSKSRTSSYHTSFFSGDDDDSYIDDDELPELSELFRKRRFHHRDRYDDASDSPRYSKSKKLEYNTQLGNSVRRNNNITNESSYLIPKELMNATSNMAIDLPQKISETPTHKVPPLSVRKARKANNLQPEVRETMKTTTKEAIKPTSHAKCSSSGSRNLQLPPQPVTTIHRRSSGDALRATENPLGSRARSKNSLKSDFSQRTLSNYSVSSNGPLDNPPTSKKDHNRLKKTPVANPSFKKREQEGKVPFERQCSSSGTMSLRGTPQPWRSPVANSVSQKNNSAKSREEQTSENTSNSLLSAHEYGKQASSISKPLSDTPPPSTSSNTSHTISSEVQMSCGKGTFQFQPVVPFVPCSDPPSPISSTPHPRSLEAKRRAGTLDITNTSEELDAILTAYHRSNGGLMGLGRFASLSLQPAYHAQLRHIASRGGRKGQYGEVLSVEEISERRARGWVKGQNKERTELGDGKDGVLTALGIPRAKNLEPVVEGGQLYLREIKAAEEGMERKKWAWGDGMQAGRGASEMQAREWAFLAKKQQDADEEMIDV